MKTAHKIRIKTTPEQTEYLKRACGSRRFIYNWGLARRKTAYKERGDRLYYNDLAALLPSLKQAHPWLAEVSSVPLQQSLRHLDTAYKNFFEGRANYPTFKKKQNDQAATYASNAFKEDMKPLPVTPKMVGLDLGLKTMVVTSDGQMHGNPASSQRMKRSWQKPNGARPGRRRAARIGHWYGRTLVKIDRFYPSSKTCSACGHVLETLMLDVREWVCPVCGACHDRDMNAAKNILAEGLSVNACGGNVRPARPKGRQAVLEVLLEPDLISKQLWYNRAIC